MAHVDTATDISRGVSRRAFIKGVIASGATASAVAYLFRGTDIACASPAHPGAVERLVMLTVNGRKRPVDVMKQETLAMTLRYKLGLTGTKLGCDRAECGNCTVLIDNVPRYACSVLTHSVRHAAIRTIEGWPARMAPSTPCKKPLSPPSGRNVVSVRPGRSCQPWASSPSIRAQRALRQPRRCRATVPLWRLRPLPECRDAGSTEGV